jgi:hypothetical protein
VKQYMVRHANAAKK